MVCKNLPARGGCDANRLISRVVLLEFDSFLEEFDLVILRKKIQLTSVHRIEKPETHLMKQKSLIKLNVISKAKKGPPI